MTEHERRTRSYLLSCAKVHLNKEMLVNPRYKNVKLNGYKIITIDDMGKIECTWESLTFTVTDHFQLYGKQYCSEYAAIYDGQKATLMEIP